MVPTSSEYQKRRRERRIALLITIGFIVSTVVQALLTARKQSYGFFQSFLYFGLVHLNLILIMLLVFLVLRNLIKAYLSHRSGTLGSSLRWRMVTSLLGFSLLPSILLFTGSSYIIRQGFERWFGGQVGRALEDAQAITDVHYHGIESNLEFFADRVKEDLQKAGRPPTAQDVEELRKRFPLQGIEVYSDLVHPPYRVLKEGLPDWVVPRATVESLQRALGGESFGLIRQYGDGDLVQRFASFPVGPHGNTRTMVAVLSDTVPLGLMTRIADLQSAFSAYHKTRILKDELKTTYTLVLLTLFLLTMFVVSWFGLYLAKSVTEPVAELLSGTEAFRKGRWDYRIPTPAPSIDRKLAKKGIPLQGAGADLEVLKSAFNLMAEEVGRRGQQLEAANKRLLDLVRELEERERYLEILLSSIRRGVVVIDNGGFIRRINAEALAFVGKSARDASVLLGRPWREPFAGLGEEDDVKAWLEEARLRSSQPADRIFEVAVPSGEQTRMPTLRSVRATGIELRDEGTESLGFMIILEDVSDAARLERLAAWQEVARRVAHEIKNPLTPIQISVDRLYKRMAPRMEQDSEDGAVFGESVRQIQKQVRVIRDLVREFSEFSKLPEPKFGTVNIANLTEEVLKDYRFTHPECQFVFRSEIASGQEVLVRADSEYLRRLVVNIADNALHSLENARIKDPMFSVTIEIRDLPATFVTIIFEDNGPGIPAAMREKIFDPYITSKASGMGLGLAIVRRIAIEHSGRIRAEEAKGGRFVLELPLLHAGD